MKTIHFTRETTPGHMYLLIFSIPIIHKLTMIYFHFSLEAQHPANLNVGPTFKKKYILIHISKPISILNHEKWTEPNFINFGKISSKISPFDEI